MSNLYEQVKILMKKGMAIEAMAVELCKSPTVIKRAVTNLKKQGVRYKMRGPDTAAVPEAAPAAPEPTKGTGERVFPPRAVKLPQTTEAALASVRDDKPVEWDLSALESLDGAEHANVAPMLTMGTVITFVKFCGGRLKAHQLIEDVYASLRAMSH